MSPLTSEQALIRAADDGIHQMPIPTPFAVGRVNSYLIEDDPLTLVDVGPNSDRALSELERHLASRQRRIEDIERILITHNHIDHFGLVEAVVGRSRAEVVALGIAAGRLGNFDRDAELDDEFAVQLMLKHGIPESIVTPLRAVSKSFYSFGAPAHVTRELEDGELIEFAGRKLRAIHRPGHSPVDTLFWDEENGYNFVGDHLIGNISSNPLLTRPLDNSDRRPKALISYLASMRETAKMPDGILLPGHGDPVTNAAELIEDRINKHHRRKEKIFALIGDHPQTAYEIAQVLWGNVAVTQAFLCLSEVIGHTDMLVDEGRVREVDDGAIVHFELTS